MSLSMTVGLVCLAGLIIIFVIKMLNILNHRKLYRTDLAIIGIVLALFFWGCYLAAMQSSLIAVDTITTSSGPITVSYGDFYDLQVFYWLVTFLMILNLFMGVIESFMAVEFVTKEFMGIK